MRLAEPPTPPPARALRTDAGPLHVDYGDLLACIHCGLCLPACPTYDLTGEERHSPRGRIQMMRAIADGRLAANDEAFADAMDRCLGCYACETACPAGVDYSRLFEAARETVERERAARGRASRLKRLVLRHVFPYPRRLKALARALRWARRSGLQTLAVRSGLLRRLAPRLAELEPLAPSISPRPSDALIAPVERPREGPVRHRVALLTGCVMNVAYAETNRRTVDLLLACGCEVYRPTGQTCCGSLHGHNGDLETARALARRNLEAFEAALPLDALDAVIVNAAGCGAFLKEVGHLLAGDPVWRDRAHAFAAKVRDVTEFLAAVERPAPRFPVRLRATVHDACHHVHAQGLYAEPRTLLAEVPGLELIPLPESTRCCGSAGIYNVLQPETAAVLGAQKLEAIRSTGAEAVVTGNPGCALQIAATARQAGVPLRVLHPVEVLHAAYLGPRS